LENSSEVDFLEQQITNSIQTLKTKTSSSKRKVGWMGALSISLGALITLTLGVDVSLEYAQLQKNIALLFGAILTVSNGWSVLFDYRKLWIRQKITLLELYQMQNELGYRKSKSEDFNVDDLFEKYLAVWENDSQEWKNITKVHSASKDKTLNK
jgi:hypothetical protein